MAAVTLPAATLALIMMDTSEGKPPPPPSMTLLPAALGALGLYLFLANDHKIKAAERGDEKIPRGLDWRPALVAASLVSLYLLLLSLLAQNLA